MNNKNKVTIGMAILFEIVLIITAISNILSKQWNNLLLSILAIICIILPFIITYIAHKKNIILPSSFNIIALLFIFLSIYFGEIRKFYRILWWWDIFLHSVFGIYGVIIALHLMKGIITKNKSVTQKRFGILIVIFAFTFSISLGTLWEIFEFLGSYLFKVDMLAGGFEDTMLDLIVKSLCAFITSMICYYRDFKTEK
ncbi:hypothetical protein [Clostridium weizhouense]|nr:hypothetical protein [Clostridium weizhouense]